MNKSGTDPMTVTETVYQYLDGKLVGAVRPRQKLLVADSWYLKDGRVRALSLHRNRFCFSCAALAGIDRHVTAAFWEQAIAKLPGTGSWFPRIELAGTIRQPVFQLRLRPSPPLRTTIRLIDCHVADFRKAPRHKGPDLTRLKSIRKTVLETGADEGILTTPSGFLLEGLTTNLLWWENNTLCTVPPSRRVLPGVTLQLIRSIAKEKNVPFATRLRKVAGLNGCEIWAVNALHGIRRATDWERSPFKTFAATDLNDWNEALRRFDEMIRPAGQTG